MTWRWVFSDIISVFGYTNPLKEYVVTVSIFILNLFLIHFQAVCCTDGEHCCPTHYSCDVSHVSCIKGDVVIPWYNKIAAQSSLTPNSDLTANKCDEQSSCSTDSTCCQLTTGEWGCCPLPQVKICVCALATEELYSRLIYLMRLLHALGCLLPRPTALLSQRLQVWFA